MAIRLARGMSRHKDYHFKFLELGVEWRKLEESKENILILFI